MAAPCVSGTVNTQGFVWKFLCTVYKFSFILLLKQAESFFYEASQQTQIQEEQAEGDDLMTRVRGLVSSSWKDMRREFKAVDKDGLGTVNELEFRRILRQFCANLSEEEFDTVVTTFDHTSNGQVSYNDFVKKFIF